ncbi:universal stress protein [Streptomyces sp. XM4193]|uniref:universal stress protein n=1 Tax=Streptomyces sp. XM4193 TaxID=2929782 RepID=UPI001FFAC7EF|nr:universal stress protein [Streptomyces sp. XM4193]MCK1797280.1 universal stress protein [Streptomyces sp. XM4193]
MTALPVIAAVDGSGHSLRALDWALAAASQRGVEVLIVHVWSWPPNAHSLASTEPMAPPAGQDPVLDWVRERLAERKALPEVRYTTLSGAPAAALPDMSGHGQLLVLGSRGRGGFTSLLLGSNGRAAAARATCPVVVVPHRDRAGETDTESHGRVVLGLEPGETSTEVVEFALSEAQRSEALLQVVTTHAVPFSTLALLGNYPDPGEGEGPAIAKIAEDAQRERLRPFLQGRFKDVQVEHIVAPGDAAGRLVAASESADLVVVGKHRHRLRPPSFSLGSVANAVLLHARCPIAAVPAGSH